MACTSWLNTLHFCDTHFTEEAFHTLRDTQCEISWNFPLPVKHVRRSWKQIQRWKDRRESSDNNKNFNLPYIFIIYRVAKRIPVTRKSRSQQFPIQRFQAAGTNPFHKSYNGRVTAFVPFVRQLTKKQWNDNNHRGDPITRWCEVNAG